MRALWHVPDEDWMVEGICASGRFDPDLWYADDNSRDTTKAKELCSVCPVRQVCLDHAILTDEYWGVWGGMTYRERQRYAGSQ